MQTLLGLSLIDWMKESREIWMDRALQEAVVRRMSREQLQEIFFAWIDILLPQLPDTYSTDVGHQASSWPQCERIVPHVESLMLRNLEFEIFPEGNQYFGELLLRSCWYAPIKSTLCKPDSHHQQVPIRDGGL